MTDAADLNLRTGVSRAVLATAIGGGFNPMLRGPTVAFAPEAGDGDGGVDESLYDAEVEEEEDDGVEGEEGDGEERPAAEKKPEAVESPAPLSADELKKRYDNTKTALSQERSARRELEKRLEALERGDSAPRAQERRPAAVADEEIDPETDPLKALKVLAAKVKSYEDAEALENQSQEERRAEEGKMRRVEAALREHETDFAEDHADYDDAAAFYAKARATELMNFGHEPAQVQQMLRREFASMAATAMGRNKNPAAVVYEMAKGRGFGRADAVDPAKAGKDGKGGKLADIARGQRASSPLGRAGGRGGDGVDAEQISRINIRTKEGRAAFNKQFAALEQQAKAGGR